MLTEGTHAVTQYLSTYPSVCPSTYLLTCLLTNQLMCVFKCATYFTYLICGHMQVYQILSLPSTYWLPVYVTYCVFKFISSLKMQIRKHCSLVEIHHNNWGFSGKKYRILKVVKRELGSDLSPATISWTLGISLWLHGSLPFHLCNKGTGPDNLFLKPLSV